MVKRSALVGALHPTAPKTRGAEHSRTVAVLIALVVLALCAGCARHTAPALPGGSSLERPLILNGHSLQLHMHTADPGRPGARPLLVYATGDGGWSGKDLGMYRALVTSGDAIVGFDAHDYVRHLGVGLAATTTPARLARDYEAIIAAARDAMHLDPGLPVVLVGVSRGAGLSVVAAGSAALRHALRGVLAAGLTREEEYARWYRRITPASTPARKTRAPGAPAERQRLPVMVQLYEYLPRLGRMPIAVVQSTGDTYLPAAAARALFGPDTRRRRFIAIQSRNHSFAGARDELYEALQSSLVWIDGAMSRP